MSLGYHVYILMRIFSKHGLEDIEEVGVFGEGIICWRELGCCPDGELELWGCFGK